MKTITLKDLWKIAQTRNKALLMSDSLSSLYPDIPDNETNFIEDYLDNFGIYDKGVLFQHSIKVFDYDDEIEEDAFTNWQSVTESILLKHLDQWARLYYGLSLHYNPLFNVDGVETTVYGATKNTSKYGSTKNTSKYGEVENQLDSAQKVTQVSIGSRTNSTTESEKAYPDNQLEPTSSTSNTLGAGTDSTTQNAFIDKNKTLQHTDEFEGTAHNDEFESIQHTDTLTRQGNIGVTKSQELLEAEYELRKRSFWDDVFTTILREGGLHYE